MSGGLLGLGCRDSWADRRNRERTCNGQCAAFLEAARFGFRLLFHLVLPLILRALAQLVGLISGKRGLSGGGVGHHPVEHFAHASRTLGAVAIPYGAGFVCDAAL